MVKMRRCCLLCLKWMQGLNQDCTAAPTAFYSPPPVFQVPGRLGILGTLQPWTAMESDWIVDCLCWTWIFGNFVPRVVFFEVILLVLSPNLTPVDMFFVFLDEQNKRPVLTSRLSLMNFYERHSLKRRCFDIWILKISLNWQHSTLDLDAHLHN